MDIDALLDVHAQDADVRTTVDQVRTMRAAIAGVEGMQYQPARQAELTANIRANAATAGADALRQMLTEARDGDAEALSDRDDAERERVDTMNGAHVDPARFTAAATAGEISSLLRDAEAVGDPDSLRRAWAFALPKLREMAGREMRQYRLPSGASAFSALTIWQSRVASLTRQTPTRDVLSDRAQRRQRELREKVLSVWRLVALDREVARHLLAADIAQHTPTNGAPAKGTLTFGKFFDQFPMKK